MTEEKNCYNCGNKNCNLYYSTVKKDYKSHFETYEYKDFDCVNHNKWEELKMEEIHTDNYSKMEQKFYNNLTKAKEIIKLLLHALKNEGSDYTFALKNTHPVLAEAEKFLKDSEVEKMTEDDFLERIDNGFN